MKGTLYLVGLPDSRNLYLTQDIESVGDGFFKFRNGEQFLFAKGNKIFKFTSPENYYGDNFGKKCNNLDDLIQSVWASHYRDSEYTIYVFKSLGQSGILGFDFECDKSDYGCRETFIQIGINNLEGSRYLLYIGSKGTLVLDCVLTVKSISVDWNKYLSPYSKVTIKLTDDIFRYVVSYKDDKNKEKVGYSRMSNYIFNYISAHPNGISSKAIERGLNLRHPSVAGRISEMDAVGRIVKVGCVRHSKFGKPNTIWKISKE